MATTIIDNLITKLGFRVDDAQLQRVRQRLQGLKDFANSIAGQMTVAGAALTGVLYKVGATVFGFEKSQNQLQATLGLTADKMKDLREQALLLGRTTRFTASEVSAAQNQLAQMGFTVSQVMEMTPRVLNLAAAGNLEMADAAALLSTQLRAYSLEAEESARVTDVLARTATISATSVAELASPFRQLGSAPALLNQELEQTAAMIGVLRNAGMLPEQAGTSLRNVFMRLSRLSKDATMQEQLREMGLTDDQLNQLVSLVQIGKIIDAMELLGKTALEASKGPEALANAQKLFEAEGGVSAIAIASNTDLVREYAEILYEAEGAAEEMRKTQGQGLVGAIYNFQSALEGLQLSLGEAGLTKWITGAAEAVTGLVGWLSELPPNVRAVAAAAIAAGPALTILGASLRFIAMAISGLAVLWSPVFGIIALIIGLVAAIFWWDELVANIKAGWKWLDENPVFSPITNSLEAVWNWLTTNPLAQRIQELYDLVKEPVKAVITTEWDGTLWAIIGIAWWLLTAAIQPISALVKTVWNDAIWPTIKDTWVGRSLTTIVGLVKAQFEEDTWTALETQWNSEGFIAGTLSVFVDAKFGPGTWAKVKAAWQGEEGGLRGIGGVLSVLIDARFGPGTWAKLKAAWEGEEGGLRGIGGVLSVAVDARFGVGTWRSLVDAWNAEKEEGGGLAGVFVVAAMAVFGADTISQLITAWNTEAEEGGGLAGVFTVLVNAKFGPGTWTKLKAAWEGEEGGLRGIGGVLSVLVDAQFGAGTWAKLKAAWEGEEGGLRGIGGVLSVVVDAKFGAGTWAKLAAAWGGGEDGEGGGIAGVLPVFVNAFFGEGAWAALKLAWDGGEGGTGGIADRLTAFVDAKFGEGTWEKIKTAWEGEDGTGGIAQGLSVGIELKTVGLETFQAFFDNFMTTINERGGPEQFNILLASLMNLGSALGEFGRTVSGSLGLGDENAGLGWLVALGEFAGGGAASAIIELAGALSELADALQWFVDNTSLATSSWIAFFQALNPDLERGGTAAEQTAARKLDEAKRTGTQAEIDAAQREYDTISGFAGHSYSLTNTRLAQELRKNFADADRAHAAYMAGADQRRQEMADQYGVPLWMVPGETGYARALGLGVGALATSVWRSFEPGDDFTRGPGTAPISAYDQTRMEMQQESERVRQQNLQLLADSANNNEEPGFWAQVGAFFSGIFGGAQQPELAPAGVGEEGTTMYNYSTYTMTVAPGAVQVDASSEMDPDAVGDAVVSKLGDEWERSVDEWDRGFER